MNTLQPSCPVQDADTEIEAILSRMTLEEKAGQMMIASFRCLEHSKRHITADNDGKQLRP